MASGVKTTHAYAYRCSECHELFHNIRNDSGWKIEDLRYHRAIDVTHPNNKMTFTRLGDGSYLFSFHSGVQYGDLGGFSIESLDSSKENPMKNHFCSMKKTESASKNILAPSDSKDPS